MKDYRKSLKVDSTATLWTLYAMLAKSLGEFGLDAELAKIYYARLNVVSSVIKSRKGR